ncbi:DUF4254 domain-containing protein [Nocardia bovistercoris]|uniref:DUF4254 domain-containing protein n=1 Tax=Nocardia bovistercoris TaxID=2785916 RepID=A0A931IDC4_9NOCA|nr:DUF4254 domain-containing protein [Nocardia bovistercoris]MBH0777708.1 DUF4254 domain-containing protein [Nocardia bovistercoris]
MAATSHYTARLLPSGEELCAAILGHHVGGHPLSRIAARLGVLYRHEAGHTLTECGCDRTELVLAADEWTAVCLPVPRSGARLHTESLGAVIDRLARLQVGAYRLLLTVEDVRDPRVHTAWYRLAELVDGYTDLADALVGRVVRLPALGDGR